ncbi:glutaredoxin family protein [Patescibacteria group bacterium]|nr:glutaredoxin family protein [Patescibacteria group bacterium]MBU1673086.1 glutaredoxin family protein [Patescibacteria group bacterium]MBU1963692.1 glutaredoxin family protein [Patescibacteria group bacterium]
MAVKIYSTPTCPYCNMAKEFFKKSNVEYDDVNVAEDEKAAQEMVDKSGQMGVPVIVVEKDGSEEVIVGFDEAKLKELLGVK